MKFRSPTDNDVHIALTNGHTALVTREGVELDPMFHKEAITRNCLPSTMADPPEPAGDASFKRASVIKEAMQAMLRDAQPGDFTGSGHPNLTKLSARCGLQVVRAEADAIWTEVSADKA